MKFIQLYESEDGTRFECEITCSYYELICKATKLESCYVFLDQSQRQRLAEAMAIIKKDQFKGIINETINPSISSQQDSSQSLDALVRPTEDWEEQTGGYSC